MRDMLIAEAPMEDFCLVSESCLGGQKFYGVLESYTEARKLLRSLGTDSAFSSLAEDVALLVLFVSINVNVEEH